MKKIITLVTWIVVVLITILILGAPLFYINYLSMFIIVIVVLPIIFAFGLFEPFMNSFKIATTKTISFDSKEVEKSIITISLTIKLVIISSLISAVIGVIAMLGSLGEASRFGPYLSFSLCSILYALFILAFICPLHAKLKTKLLK